MSSLHRLRGMGELGGFAVAHSGAPRSIRGRSSGLQGAAHRAARDSPAGCPEPWRFRQP